MTPQPSRLARWCLHRLTSHAAARVILDDIAEQYSRSGPDDARVSGWAVEREAWAYVRGLAGLSAARLAQLSGVVLRDAGRAIRSAPRTSLFILGILTLAISTATVTFSVVDAIVLRPLPYLQPNALVAIEAVRPTPGSNTTAAAFEFDLWRTRTESFTAIAATRGPGEQGLPDIPPGQSVLGLSASASLFDVLAVRPYLGRLFTEEDEAAQAERVAVISHALWTNTFGADPLVINRLLGSGNDAIRIVGVMPPGFTYPAGTPVPTDVWTPLVIAPEHRSVTTPGVMRAYTLVGRLQPGVTAETAQADIRAASQTLEAARPGFLKKVRYDVRPVRDVMVGDVKPIMLLALWAVVLVTAIACVNVANVALTRATTRAREMALRASLGAGRSVIIAGLVVEGVMLSLFAATVSLAISLMTVDAVRAMLPEGLALSTGIAINGRVFLFAVFAAVCTGVGFTLVPAVQASRADLNGQLKQGAATSTPRRQVLRSAFLIAEVAIVTVLLVSAVLVTTSFRRVVSTDLGFGREGLVTAPLFGFQGSVADAESRFSAIPGVTSVSLIAGGSPPLLPWGSASTNVSRVGAPPDAAPISAEYRRVSPNYFRTVATPVIRGREFTADDRVMGAAVILDETCARAIFGHIDVVGEQVQLPFKTLSTVVGIVANVRIGGAEQATGPQAYLPITEDAAGIVVLRTDGSPHALAQTLRSMLAQQLAPAHTMTRVEVLSETFWRLTANRRASAVVMAVFGGLALLISLAGVYGVVSATVAQQTREFGVRMALGATPVTIMQNVLRRTGSALALGGAIGLPAAAVLARSSQDVLFQTDPLDPMVYLVVAVSLALAGLAAAVVPARRAGRVDPLVILRTE